jgi:predicted RNase H-like HicB family nuclease
MSAPIEISISRETDGRYIADASHVIPGALAYGETDAEATCNVQAWILRALADRVEHREQVPNIVRDLFVMRMRTP